MMKKNNIDVLKRAINFNSNFLDVRVFAQNEKLLPGKNMRKSALG